MDTSSFESIVRETKKFVLAAVSRTLSPKLKDHIDDVVQETYIKAFRKLKKSSICDIKSLENYLYTIAKNESIKLNKKEGRYLKICTELQITTPAKTQDRSVIEELKEVIINLPEKYRTVIELFNKGFSLNEIGQKLDLKTGAVKSKLFRGRKIIINQMKRRCVYEEDF
jgi:RNA polymerase sigma-70 factor, ECF subfamily